MSEAHHIAVLGTGSLPIKAGPSMKVPPANMIFPKGPNLGKQAAAGEAAVAVIIRNLGLPIPLGPFQLRRLL